MSAWTPRRLRTSLDRRLTERFNTLTVPLRWGQGVVSMTFDDAPVSAFEQGADAVREAGGFATFYCSLGLMSHPSPCGLLGSPGHLQRAWSCGHELGCHTFDHVDAWSCDNATFMASITRNANAYAALIPGFQPRTFAYPKQGARWSLKRQVSSRFTASRGGRPTAHFETADLNLLRCVFLDETRRPAATTLHHLIERTAQERGWLILATHDVSPQPSPYGCHVRDLRYWLRQSTSAGLRLLTVERASLELQEVAGAGGRS